MAILYPATSKSLLGKLASDDEISWAEFYALYAPIAHSLGRLKGLSDAESDDLVQEVMLRFFKQRKSFVFDPEIARFRTYFARIVQCAIIDLYRRKKDRHDLELSENLPADPIFEAALLAEWRNAMFRAALNVLKERVTPEKFAVFEYYALQNHTANETAENFQLPVDQVYLVKSRCVAELKKITFEINRRDEKLNLPDYE